MASIAPTTALDKHILEKMCHQSAVGIKMQCGREYFPEETQNPRATQLFKLAQTERRNIPTENLAAERYLGKFGYLVSISAVHRNKNFKAKRIHDDLMFQASDNEDDVCKSTDQILQSLRKMEVKWTNDQKVAHMAKIAMNLKKRAGLDRYKELLLQKCKKHIGPVTAVKDI